MTVRTSIATIIWSITGQSGQFTRNAITALLKCWTKGSRMDTDKAYIDGYAVGYRAATRSATVGDLNELYAHCEKRWLEAFAEGRELGRLEAVLKYMEVA